MYSSILQLKEIEITAVVDSELAVMQVGHFKSDFQGGLASCLPFQDLIQVQSGQLSHHLKKIIAHCTKHVYKCKVLLI